MTLIVRPEMRQYQLLDLLLEFKLVKLAEAGLTGEQIRSLDREQLAALPAVQAGLAEARSQLQRYRTVLQATYGSILRLRTYAVVGLGFERLVWEEVSGAVGVTEVAQPGGSLRNADVIAACDRLGLAMCFTGRAVLPALIG